MRIRRTSLGSGLLLVAPAAERMFLGMRIITPGDALGDYLRRHMTTTQWHFASGVTMTFTGPPDDSAVGIESAAELFRTNWPIDFGQLSPTPTSSSP